MIKSFIVDVRRGVYQNASQTLPIKPRDLKTLAAFLNAFADAPEAVDMFIGPFHIQVEVAHEV